MKADKSSTGIDPNAARRLSVDLSTLSDHVVLLIPTSQTVIDPASDMLLQVDYEALPSVWLDEPERAGASFSAQTMRVWCGGETGRVPSVKGYLLDRAEQTPLLVTIAGAEWLVDPRFRRMGAAFLLELADAADALPTLRMALCIDPTALPALSALSELLAIPARVFGVPVRDNGDSPDDPLHELAELRARHAALQTQLEQQQRATQAVELLKRTIVSTVSHELNTPLLQIKTAVHMLAEDSTRDRDTLLNLAIDAAARLQAQVQNITQLAQTLDLQRETSTARDTIDQALANLRRSWTTKGKLNRIEIDVPNGLPAVYVDRKAIGVVLYHLIDNALKFSDERVIVRAAHDSGCVMMRVSDQGIGIAPEIRDRIFDLFFQGDSSTTKKYNGLGIGLAIVRLILERHNIPIVLENADNGCTFAFPLPLKSMA